MFGGCKDCEVSFVGVRFIVPGHLFSIDEHLHVGEDGVQDVVDRCGLLGYGEGRLIIILYGVFYVEAGFTQVCVVVALFEGGVKSGGCGGKGIVGVLGSWYGFQNIFLSDGDGV